MSAWEIYWWLKLDDFRSGAEACLFVGSLLSTIFIMAYLFLRFELGNEPLAKKFFRLFQWALAVVILGGTCFMAFPSTKQYAVIKILPGIVNSDFAREATGDARELYDMAKGYLKEIVTERGKEA